jgi:hypothetical protein
MLKAKIITIFLLPAVTLYAIVAGIFYRGVSTAFLDLEVLKTAAVMAVLCALAQDIVPRSFKEALVFWRIRNRLPGCRAFSQQSNDRFNLQRITNLNSLKELDGASQQRIFYKVYKRHSGDSAVSAKSFRYLAWRDTASTYFVLGLLTIPVAYSLQGSFSYEPAIKLTAFALGAYLLTSFTARLTAHDLVSQVLSCETAEHPHAIT